MRYAPLCCSHARRAVQNFRMRKSTDGKPFGNCQNAICKRDSLFVREYPDSVYLAD